MALQYHMPLHLYPVTQTKIYTSIKNSILTTWGLYFIFLLATLFFYGKKDITIRLMMALTFTLIIIGISIPADIKSLISDWGNNQINSAGNVLENNMIWDLTKVGHFIGELRGLVAKGVVISAEIGNSALNGGERFYNSLLVLVGLIQSTVAVLLLALKLGDNGLVQLINSLGYFD